MSADREALRQQQTALARALTGQEASVRNPIEPCLSGLDRDELARAAETLIRKRVSQTRAALRKSAAILGERFGSEFRVFAQTHFFSGPDAIWKDAIEFSRWLARRHPDPDWLRDTLKWERAQCLWQSRRFYLSLLRLRYELEPWNEQWKDKHPPRHWQLLLLWRVGKRGSIFRFPRRSSLA